jgi:FemAB-related protein (PEP-CTERM system-associated)
MKPALYVEETVPADQWVRRLKPNQPAGWPEDLAQQAGFTALDSWSDFIQKVYGYPGYRLAAGEEDTILGLAALTHVRHPFFGNYLTTAPFASYGGFSAPPGQVRNALLAEVKNLAAELGVEYALVRHLDRQDTVMDGWLQHAGYATYIVDLADRSESLLADYSSDHRNHIRKSLRKGFAIRFGGHELVEDAYEVLARSMHELGSPYHSQSYLWEMVKSLGDTLELAVVYTPQGNLAGGGVFIRQENTVTNLHANILRRYRQDYAGEFFYWSVIERCCQRGMRKLDLGRSLIGSGNEVFKLKWKPKKQLLAYWHWLRPGAHLPDLNQKNPKFALAIWTWKHLPGPVVRMLGPSLIRGLA